MWQFPALKTTKLTFVSQRHRPASHTLFQQSNPTCPYSLQQTVVEAICSITHKSCAVRPASTRHVQIQSLYTQTPHILNCLLKKEMMRDTHGDNIKFICKTNMNAITKTLPHFYTKSLKKEKTQKDYSLSFFPHFLYLLLLLLLHAFHLQILVGHNYSPKK